MRINGILEEVSIIEEMKKGKYTQFSDAWSTEQYSHVNTYNDVSEFAYNLVGCRWDFLSGSTQIIVCPLRFILWQ